MVFYPTISKRVHRKKLMTIMQIISIVGYAIMLIAGLALPAIMLKFYLITIGYMLSNFGMYCFYLVMMISIINTVEYNEYKYGTRNEAIISSLRPFFTKMGSALVVVITTATYLIFGVTNYTNQISELENQAARNLISDTDKLSAIEKILTGISSSQTNGLLIGITIVPLVFMLASYFLYKKHYKLDEPEYDRICKELEARRAQAKS